MKTLLLPDGNRARRRDLGDTGVIFLLGAAVGVIAMLALLLMLVLRDVRAGGSDG